MEKREPSYTVGGNANQYSHYGEKCGDSLKNWKQEIEKQEIELPYDPAVPLLGIHTEETRSKRDTCTPMFIAALFIIARTWKQPRCPSADEWLRKLWYIYNMEYYSAIKKNTFASVLMRWMKLEPIIQGDVSQKDKYQYSILMHMYGIQKDGNDNPVCRTERDTDVQYRLLDSVGEGEGGMIQENSIETCILSSVKYIASPGWMNETSAQSWCTGRTQMDGMGREEGGVFRMGDTCKSMADSCQCMPKTTTIL